MWYVNLDGGSLEEFINIDEAIEFIEVTKLLSCDIIDNTVSGIMWCQDEDARVVSFKNGISTIISKGELYYYTKDLTEWDYLNNVKLYF